MSKFLGDALRDIDGMSIIRNEFILLTSFVVSNAQLIPILEQHKYNIIIFNSVKVHCIIPFYE